MRENAPVPKSLRLWLAGAILAVGIAFIFVVFQAARMAEVSDPRAMDQAQIARNLSRGAGYTTRLLRPLSLSQIPQVENHPELVNAPLHPVCMSIMFRIFGPSARTVSWTTGLAFLLTIPLVLWLAWHVFSRKVAMLAIFIVATNIGLLNVAVSGTEGALLGLLFTAVCLVLVYQAERPALRLILSAAAGALAALLYLTNYLWIVALAPILLVVILNTPASRRVTHIAVFLAAFVLFAAPWMVRTWRVTGNPLFNLSAYDVMLSTRSHPGNTIYRSYESTPPGVLSFVLTAPREIYQKMRDAAAEFYPLIFSLAGVVVMPFFIVATMIPMGNTGVDRTRLGVYGTIVLIFLALCLTVPDGRLLMPVAGVATVVAAAFFYQLLDLRVRSLTGRMQNRWASTAVTILLLVHAMPLFLQLAPGRPMGAAAPLAVRRASDELRAVIRDSGGGSETAPAAVYTDMPWAVAWYADRPAIWMPRNDMDIRRLEQKIGQVRWLVLTPQVLEVAGPELADRWASLWRSGWSETVTTGQWRVRQRFANGNWILFERVPDVASVGSLTGSTP
ncbi:MAG: glycosyltransferase family 39 protein [Armatimonadia bacterium]